MTDLDRSEPRSHPSRHPRLARLGRRAAPFRCAPEPSSPASRRASPRRRSSLAVGTASAFGTVRDLCPRRACQVEDRLPELPRRSFRRLRDEHRRERSAEADGQAERLFPGLVARRAKGRLRERRSPPDATLRPLRHEHRRERAAEADARPGERRRAGLVARRAEDRLHKVSCAGGRPGAAGVRRLRHQRRRQRRAEPDGRRA